LIVSVDTIAVGIGLAEPGRGIRISLLGRLAPPKGRQLGILDNALAVPVHRCQTGLCVSISHLCQQSCLAKLLAIILCQESGLSLPYGRPLHIVISDRPEQHESGQ